MIIDCMYGTLFNPVCLVFSCYIYPSPINLSLLLFKHTSMLYLRLLCFPFIVIPVLPYIILPYIILPFLYYSSIHPSLICLHLPFNQTSHPFIHSSSISLLLTHPSIFTSFNTSIPHPVLLYCIPAFLSIH